jgi:hypothetical protein
MKSREPIFHFGLIGREDTTHVRTHPTAVSDSETDRYAS